ncbi:hypothetical protein Tco_0777812 [Tanacetum coccineum]
MCILIAHMELMSILPLSGSKICHPLIDLHHGHLSTLRSSDTSIHAAAAVELSQISNLESGVVRHNFFRNGISVSGISLLRLADGLVWVGGDGSGKGGDGICGSGDNQGDNGDGGGDGGVGAEANSTISTSVNVAIGGWNLTFFCTLRRRV